jgi:repressor LexA
MRADPPTDAETYRRPLTARQAAVLRTLIDWTLVDGFQPSLAELAAVLGVSSAAGVACHLAAIERKGWIERARQPRAVRIIGGLREARRLALEMVEDERCRSCSKSWG